MRKFFLLLAIVMVCCTGAVFAQAGSGGDVTISLDNVTNSTSATQLSAGNTHVFSIRYNLLEANPGAYYNGNTAFEVYSPDQADWGGLYITAGPLVAQLLPTTAVFLTNYEFIAAANRYIRTGTQGTVPARGYVPGEVLKAAICLATVNSYGNDGFESAVDNDIAFTGTFSTRLEDGGLHMCIDSVHQQGTQAWEWGYGSVTPTHMYYDNGLGESGPRCWEIYNPVQPKTLEADPTQLNFEGEVGGSVANQTFAVTEQSSANIAYTAAPTATGTWINLASGASGTTPGTVEVALNLSSFTEAGTFVDSIGITSDEATNTAWVKVNLTLTQGNRPPVVNPVAAQTVDEAVELTFNVTATDPDETTPQLQAVQLPGEANFVDNGDGTGTFTWTPTYDDAGEYTAIFRAYDGELYSPDVTVTITVNNVDRAPVLAEIGSKQTHEGINLNFGVSASDMDGDDLTLSAVDVPDGASFTDNGGGTGTFDWTPGNTDAGMYEVLFIASDGTLADSELVNIEVIDADGFVADPSSLSFASDFGGVNPDAQTFDVSVSDGSNVPFTVEENASWFSVEPTSSTTPATISVSVDLTGLAGGQYTDSIMISDATPQSALSLDGIWVKVNLTINYNLTVNPSELNFEFTQGASVDPQTFNVMEMGEGMVSFAATTTADFFTLQDATGTTPGVVSVVINDNLDPGTYNGTVTVASDDVVNSPLEVAVHATVMGCPSLVATNVLYDYTIFAGESVTFDESIGLTSTGPTEIDWTADVPDGSPFTFDPASGTTPSNIGVHYDKMFASQGQFADTAMLVSSDELCPSMAYVITNVMVNRPPSADTVIVVNTPAVPGMRVAVPVIFTNSCPLSEALVSLTWGSDQMYLDSVSFVGSALEYVTDKRANIDNDLWEVQILFDTHEQEMVPSGSLQPLAMMYFSLGCDIEDGDYALVPGGYHVGDDKVYFVRNCTGETETELPEYIPGGIVVGTASNYVCGYVVDEDDNEIEGATVELWQDYPGTEALMTTASSAIGSFAFDEISVIPFDLYAYKEGYYPGKVENINFGDKGIKIVLKPLATLNTPSQWVDYYCGEAGNYYLGALAPIASVVEAWTPDGLLVGRKVVSEVGQYSFMPVYRASSQFNDDGAHTGDHIVFTINGLRAVTSGDIVYPAEYARVEVCLDVRGSQEKECTLFEGWNLISWNVDTDSDDIMDVLAPIMDYVDVVLGFEQGGLTFDPNLQQFSTLWRVDHLSGYWVRIEGISEVTLTVTGLPVPEVTPIPLTAGWNLVSFLPEESWNVADALSSVVGLVEFAYGFPDGEIQVWEPGGSFNQLETFDPCNGYWVKVTDDGVLTYDQSLMPAAAKRTKAAASRNDGFVTTNWMNLYANNLTVNGTTVTAGTAVTAYAANNDREIGEFTMKSDGLFGFMPVYADAAGEDELGMKAGDQFYLKVNGNETDQRFTWTTTGDRKEIGALTSAASFGSLPTGYSLGQNYPNPFNPTTTITFYMPAGGSARLEVYNVLGRLVSTPFNGQAVAGENSVVWDGRDSGGQSAASGVYFYRLTADNYTETKKMMLLK